MTSSLPKLFNPLSDSLEILDLTSPVGIYVCGITPYDTTHLGHAFTYTSYDVLVRLLRFLNYEVSYVQNITDIDDDVLLRAGTLGVDWKDLGDREVEKFRHDAVSLNNLPPDVMPRATEHINEITDFVGQLLANNVAYESEGSVYFEVKRAGSFGTRLFRRTYDEQLSTANKHGNFPDDPAKRDPLDFVLWQRTKQGEPSWPSPWGAGRPGWHIECSAMSQRYLGNSFAIHGGGSDLLFPHHECEIAQAEFSHGELPAKYWMHTGMVHYEGEKMSKSLGNMVFVADLLSEHTGNAIRLCLLAQHYREPWTYEASLMERAEAIEARLSVLGTSQSDVSSEDLESLGCGVLDALKDDMNTPLALTELVQLAESGERNAQGVAEKLASSIFGLRWDQSKR